MFNSAALVGAPLPPKPLRRPPKWPLSGRVGHRPRPARPRPPCPWRWRARLLPPRCLGFCPRLPLAWPLGQSDPSPGPSRPAPSGAQSSPSASKELKQKQDEYIDEKHTAKQNKGAACCKGEAERGKGLGVWLGPLLAATRAASRSPRLEYAPPHLQQRRRGFRPPSPRASWNMKPRAYAITRLPPAPRRPRWGSGCGCSLYPPPPRSPRLEHAPPRLQQRAALTWPSATVATRQPE
eukprot:scaffold812_cov126-Isochrysis_galbana.AAC.3